MTRRLAPGTVGRFVLVRLAATVVLLLALSFVVFTLLHLTPGDPARNLLGPKNPSPEALAAVRAKYRLDEPFIRQYLLWLNDVAHGRFGTSIRSDTAVTTLLADRVVMMTNGPNATIGKVLKVDLPRPRDRKELLRHPDFYAYRQEVLRFLAEYDHGPKAHAA